jgi:preprotein translocase subunit SecF
MPLDERMGKRLRVAVPVTLGIILAGFLGAALASESFPLGGEFNSTIFVRVWWYRYGEMDIDKGFVTATVEEILGEKGIPGSPHPGVLMEVPVEYDESLAGELENELAQRIGNDLVGRGAISENELENTISELKDKISVMEIGPRIPSEHLARFGLAIACVLVFLGILALVIHRHRRVAWSLPLVIGLDIVDLLGLMVLVGLPFGWGSMLGVMIVLMHAITTNILMVSRIKTGEDPARKAREAAKTGLEMMLGVLIFCGAFTALLEFPQFLDLMGAVTIGSLVNILNTSWLNAEILARRVKPAEVKYHVSL